DVLERLDWMRRVLGPAMGAALRTMPDGVDLRSLIGQALHMGDECHNRNRAASALLIKALAPQVAALESLDAAERRRVLEFAAGNEHFFLNVGMAACKAAMGAARDSARWSPSWLATAPTSASRSAARAIAGLPDHRRRRRACTSPGTTPT